MFWENDFIQLLLAANTILAFYVVFRRKRSVAASWAWLIILIIFPVLGFILYGFVSRGLSQENLFAINNQKHIGLDNVNKMIPKVAMKAGKSDTSGQADILIDYFNWKNDAPLSKNNKVSFFTDGKEKFKHLFEDIKKAQATINIEYYSFMNDDLGNKFLDLLVKKAKQGVKIRLIYDPWGSPGATKAWFQPLINQGGEVIAFITAQNMVTKCRMNYHLHRKVVVIDGKISWTGGFNVGDQYLGNSKKFGYWRDTHLRIVGSASLCLQERFVMDWNASIRNKDQAIIFSERLFPKITESNLSANDVATQIVSDGPDQETPYLRNGMMRLMMLARKSIWIQTPYLVPDDPMIATWVTAAHSGVEVRIMIPCMPDHPFIYRATQWYANYLLHEGIKIYIYNNGFLHAKTVTVDDNFSAVGSMNQDYRSYELNFEADAVFYDSNVTKQLKNIFEDDLKNCSELTLAKTSQWSRWLRFKQAFSRLLSPIL
ncbi:cardiolipin synthase [Lactobacillus hominis]|uniref:Cardiolipin synthase n=1 Tax=Lactobacillus hominis DSM 23910 = CRBIP 24.179 TaxID=1423758 RepID=I7L5K8_9LACO|nr:cardiolipin synthase [Lactobacillus hominis]KRM84761.1 cardiolipinsynthetase [Lactobacillus hominis DSM 23910 = CRBIP 24.179]MCT3347804.1 cardiolipin synthase [Lactobacillus hominis]CCI81432.1 Cardiolipin synthetase [Lactobacillus hominis DSM 23910 = CRBIP 24.179]